MKWCSSSYVLALCPVFMFVHGLLQASNVATQTITFSIEPISEIAFSSDPPPLVTSQALPGEHPTDTYCSCFYAVTSNGDSEKIVASINTPMPVGTSLYVNLTAPNGATSQGSVDLNTSNQNTVTGISQVAQGNLPVCYMFESSASAGVLPLTSRIVTYTLSP